MKNLMVKLQLMMLNLYDDLETFYFERYTILREIGDITTYINVNNYELIHDFCNQFIKRTALTSFVNEIDWVTELLDGDSYENSFKIRLKLKKEIENLKSLRSEVKIFLKWMDITYFASSTGYERTTNMLFKVSASLCNFITYIEADMLDHMNFYVDERVFRKQCFNIQEIDRTIHGFIKEGFPFFENYRQSTSLVSHALPASNEKLSEMEKLRVKMRKMNTKILRNVGFDFQTLTVKGPF